MNSITKNCLKNKIELLVIYLIIVTNMIKVNIIPLYPPPPPHPPTSHIHTLINKHFILASDELENPIKKK